MIKGSIEAANNLVSERIIFTCGIPGMSHNLFNSWNCLGLSRKWNIMSKSDRIGEFERLPEGRFI